MMYDMMGSFLQGLKGQEYNTDEGMKVLFPKNITIGSGNYTYENMSQYGDKYREQLYVLESNINNLSNDIIRRIISKGFLEKFRPCVQDSAGEVCTKTFIAGVGKEGVCDDSDFDGIIGPALARILAALDDFSFIKRLKGKSREGALLFNMFKRYKGGRYKSFPTAPGFENKFIE